MDPVVDPAAAASAPPPAAPSSPIDATGAIESMTPNQRATWRETGALPDSFSVGPAGAEKDAERDDAPAVDAKGAPIVENGKPISKREQRLNERIRQGVETGLKTERERTAALERELSELKARSGQPPAAAQEPAKQPAAQPAAEDREPVLDDFLDQPDPYLALTNALVDYRIEQREKAAEAKRSTQTAAQQAQDAAQRQFTNYQERETAFKASVPDFDAKTEKVRHSLNLQSPLTIALIDSPVAPQLVLHLAEHPEDYERIGRLGASNLPAALRELGKLEAKYDTPSPSAAPASADVVLKTVTSAPDPAPTLGKRPAEPADSVESAIRRRDPGAYIREQNARELAASRK